MRWKLFADLAEVAGTDEVVVPGQPDTVGEALDALLDAHPALADRVLDGDTLAADVNLLREGSVAEPSDPVAPGDELALFPPVSGG